MIDLVEILTTLSNAAGPSGNETPVRRAIQQLLQGHVDSMRVDALGNLIAFKKGHQNGHPRVLITAHMDEVGFMVEDHLGDGALKVRAIGGIPERILPGLRVLVGPDLLPGVIGLQAIHRSHGNSGKAPELGDLAVDIGAASKDEAVRLAPLGTTMIFATQAHRVGNLLAGKAFDDRAGCSVLAGLLQGEAAACDVYGVFTVQEEVGLRGAQVAAYAVQPDVSFALEGTIADDLPKEDKDSSPTTRLGSGPAITVMDRSYVTRPKLLSYVIRTAAEHHLPYQFKQPGIGGTESGSIQRARAGVPSITIAVPCRYIHSPIALLDPHDLTHTFELAQAVVLDFTSSVVEPEIS